MKVKIALLGLFLGNSIVHPIYADQYEYPLEKDQTDGAEIVEKGDLDAEETEKDQDEVESESFIKLGATLSMGPAILLYQDQVSSFKNSFNVSLTFKADVLKVWHTKDATVDISDEWG